MKRLLLLTILLVTGILGIVRAGQAQTKELELNTYHISPTNSYKFIRLFPQINIGSFGDTCTDEGAMQVSDNGTVFFCHDQALTPPPGLWQQDGDVITLTDQSTLKRVGIRTNIPEFKLTLVNDAGILADGTEACDPNNPLSNYKDGIPIVDYSMMLWYPQKGAFLAVKTGSSIEERDIGYYSTALGNQTRAAGLGSFVAGSENKVGLTNPQGTFSTAPFSSILGGQSNTIWLETDLADCDRYNVLGSYILGGNLNKIERLGGNIIGGGYNNNISDASSSAILGGNTNTISAGQTTQRETLEYVDSAGLDATTNRTNSLILGGFFNKIYAANNAIAGGRNNKIQNTAAYSGILGGYQNEIKSMASVIGGGYYNTIGADNFSVIGSGYNNKTTGTHDFTLSGYNYEIPGNHSTLAAGAKDTNYGTLSGDHSVLGVGHNHILGGDYSFVGPAYNYWTSGDHSILLNGNSNAVYGNFSSSVLSNCNHNYSSCHFKDNSIVNNGGEFLWLGGLQTKNNNGKRNFIWSSNLYIDNSNSDVAILTGSSAFRVGIGTATPEQVLDVAGNLLTKDLIITSLSPLSGGSIQNLDVATEEVLHLDLAEEFYSLTALEAGDVVVADKDNPVNVVKSSEQYAKNVIGVVSESPALLFSFQGIIANPEKVSEPTHTPPVALTGRVLIKASTENGVIEPGDLLTSSSIPGVAMKATDIEKSRHAIVGKALEKFNTPETNGKILAVIFLR